LSVLREQEPLADSIATPARPNRRTPSPEIEGDPRWQLVERIIASPSFAKSERLSSFLTCVCQLAQSGQTHNINEQYIGSVVFGRNPDYDPGIDSIVRSHASRLRHRLGQYFTEEGAEEELLLTIPKGGYTPVFELRHAQIASSRPATPRPFPDPAIVVFSDVQQSPAVPVLPSAAEMPRDNKSLVRVLIVALIATTLIAAASIGALVLERRHAHPLIAISDSVPLFWSSLFNANNKTNVVIADSGLVILQNLTKRRITLDSYLNGDYLKTLPPGPYSPAQTVNIGTRRYTSIVDLGIQNHLFHIPGLDLDRTQFRYARDLRMDDIKQGDLVLLGTYESTPWVQLFEPSMNFYFENELTDGVFSIINRNPRPGEQPKYDSVANDPNHTIYGLVAYRPTLSGSGKVLILEGQSMAGTETAADFVFDDGYLLPFLRSIRKPDGSIPYFELLLRSRSIGVEASRLEVIASRVENR
jgi:hypothetical protein